MDDAPRMMFRETFRVRLWAMLHIPLLSFARPSVLQLDDAVTVVRIPFRRRTKNHLGSMYFGALSIGADVAGGLAAMRAIEASGGRVSLIFKDFRAEFLRRAEGEVHFRCDQGEAIRELVAMARSSGEREEMAVHVAATVPSEGDDPVARFTLTLSIKARARA